MTDQIELLLSEVSGKMDARYEAQTAIDFQSRVAQAVTDFLTDGNFALFLITIENLTNGISK